MKLASLPLTLSILAAAGPGAAAGLPQGAARPPAVIKALPASIRISGLVVALDPTGAEIAIRGHRGVRRAFEVVGPARERLAAIQLGDEVVLTCRAGEDGPAVVAIEIVSI